MSPVLFVFACVYWCPTHIVLCFCFVCLRLVYHMLPVFLHCPFWIAPLVLSNFYLFCQCSCSLIPLWNYFLTYNYATNLYNCCYFIDFGGLVYHLICKWWLQQSVLFFRTNSIHISDS
jgi:hypothetical protein